MPVIVGMKRYGAMFSIFWILPDTVTVVLTLFNLITKRRFTVSHLVKFTLVAIGEDISNDRTGVVGEVRFGCKVAVEKVWTTDVALTVAEPDGNMEELDGCITELDSITAKVLNGDGTNELVLTKDISVLLIVGTTALVNNNDVGIDTVELVS